ncbi:MAG: protein-L-isoaspartate(D-aspartate) O-methyltransferase [Pirellulaceae bacterium]|jgi:protein-L-isoaspartate(D-aspartate) O-methyltransferase|nr:protein-L-isoaspartate(D-aspartate) O-methyltransferase [Pirellulaceae bacterium]MDP7014587.1 protein-L-isoaspartate(D-aspartate) O-methyltransferase [Pirellulaceae bacterium]
MAAMTDGERRDRMVIEQIERRGVCDPRVLRALREVPRELFVKRRDESRAFDDGALPIDCDQTISQPYIVALMSAALELSGDERVLEIGAGSGYQTAVLSRLAGEVIAIERHDRLTRSAAERLNQLGCANVTIGTGDGMRGDPERAPFDRILIAAATAECPEPLWDQLAEGGILVGPFGPASGQILKTLHKRDGKRHERSITGCRFVPLIAGLPDPPLPS